MRGPRRKKIFHLMIQENQGILWDPIHHTRTPVPDSHSLPLYLFDKKDHECHILLDTVDQDFLNEKLPRLSYWDRRRLLKTHMDCRFGGDGVGCGVIRKTKKGYYLTGWHLLERDKVGLWTHQLKQNAIPVRSIKSVPHEWGRQWDLLSFNPTLVVNLSSDSVLRQWYYDDGQCVLSRTTSPKKNTPTPSSRRDTIHHEIHLSLSYLMRRGIDLGDLRVIIQSSLADRVDLPDHLTGIHSMVFKEIKGTFDQHIYPSLARQKKDFLPYIPKIEKNSKSHRHRQRLKMYGVLAALGGGAGGGFMVFCFINPVFLRARKNPKPFNGSNCPP